MNITKKLWRPACGLYVFIYLPWFFWLENKITLDTPGIHILDNKVDKIIPFLEVFIIPYVLWFFYIASACVYMNFKATDREFIQLAVSLIAGMSIAMFICMLYPNGITLRPEHIPDNIFGKAVAKLYLTDTSTNVFPSIHCYNSMAVHIALSKCEAFKKHRVLKVLSLILCILICLSTMFLKQHSTVDFLGAIVLMSVMYVLLYAIDYKKVFKKISKCA